MQIFKNIKSLITDNYRKDRFSVVSRLHHLISRELNLLRITMERIEEWRDLDNAKGTTLDRIGRNFVEPRLNQSDEQYRASIATKIAANKSAGDIETINEVCATLFGEDYINAQELWDNWLYDHESAAFRILIAENGKSAIPSPYINRVAAGGVRILWELDTEPKVISVNPSFEAFAFESNRCGMFVANGGHGGSIFRRGRLM